MLLGWLHWAAGCGNVWNFSKLGWVLVLRKVKQSACTSTNCCKPADRAGSYPNLTRCTFVRSFCSVIKPGCDTVILCAV